MSLDYLEKIQQKLGKYQEQIQDLQDLKERIQENQTAFDKDDLDAIDALISRVQAKQATCQDELNKKQNLYEITIKKMQDQLRIRAQILDAVMEKQIFRCRMS